MTIPSPTATAEPSPRQMVDALHTAFGDHHARAVHAKGVMAEGVFTPAAEARALSGAALFSAPATPIVVRFSDFTGIPDIPDTDGGANPRGMAVKFLAPGDAGMDIVAHSFNGFPTRTSGEFRELLIAIGTSGPGAAKPTPLEAFLASHPVAKTFLTTQKPAPRSFATLSYFGVNAFRYEGPDGEQRHVRYRFVPADGEAFLTAGELAAAPPDYLQRELPARLAGRPIVFEWFAQIAEAGDAIDDPSIAWPENRSLVHLGTLRLLRSPADPAASDRGTAFLPGNLPPGIEPADPMLGVRQRAYPISFLERQ